MRGLKTSIAALVVEAEPSKTRTPPDFSSGGVLACPHFGGSTDTTCERIAVMGSMTFGVHTMNTHDREEIERHFAMRVASDRAQSSVTYGTYIEDAPSDAVDVPTKMLWFEVVGRGKFSESLFHTLYADLYLYGFLPGVTDAEVMTTRFRKHIVGIAFTFDA